MNDLSIAWCATFWVMVVCLMFGVFANSQTLQVGGGLLCLTSLALGITIIVTNNSSKTEAQPSRTDNKNDPPKSQPQYKVV